MKIITIIGARPQFIKSSILSNYIINNYPNIEEIIIHTGQHYDYNMSEVFFNQLNIPKPKYNLNISSLPHGAMTGRMLEQIEEKLIIEKPDVVIVYGDTNSTLAGALAAKKLNIKLVHIESGLRSFDMKMPEEINRILTDRISDILFCPNEISKQNLLNEGVDINKIVICGDIMLDSAIYYSDKYMKPNINLKNNFIIATIHREENSNIENIKSIFGAFKNIDNQIIIPLHPRLKNIINKINIPNNVIITEPVNYLEMIYLLKNCDLVITDSGGLQKESFFFNKKCLVLRNNTEWVELVDLNYNILVGCDKERIIKGYNDIIEINPNFNINIYGDGKAHKKIINEIISYFK